MQTESVMKLNVWDATRRALIALEALHNGEELEASAAKTFDDIREVQRRLDDSVSGAVFDTIKDTGNILEQAVTGKKTDTAFLANTLADLRLFLDAIDRRSG
jgi:hypothetical protein